MTDTARSMTSNEQTFQTLADGADFAVNGLRYRKTRPWAPQQWNASLMDETVVYEDHEPFAKFEPDQQVKQIRSEK